MKFNINILKKVCSIITTSCFILTIISNYAFAMPQLSTQKEQQKYFLFQNNQKLNNISLDRYGKICESKNNSSDTVVINIQDLHCDYSVQKNISSIIETLTTKYNINKIYVEGAYDKLDLSLLNKVNVDFKDSLIENLLKSSKITASEYFALKTNNEKKLCAIENKDVYLKNIERLKNIINNKENNAKYLASIDKEIDFLKSKYLNKENKELSNIISNYDEGKISQKQYFELLLEYSNKFNIKTQNYKNIMSYLGISTESNLLDYNSIKEEMIDVIKELRNNLSYDDYVVISKSTNNFSDFIKIKEVLNSYKNYTNKDLLISHRNLQAYVLLQEKTKEFNPLELVKEENKLVNTIRVFLSKDKNELEVAYISDFEKYFKGYMLSSLTPAQWNYLKIGIDKFQELYSKYSVSNEVEQMKGEFAQLNNFYENNDLRNEIFVNNMKLSYNKKSVNVTNNSPEYILSNAKEIVILVSGGYHTVGVNNILNNRNISYITITPNISNSNYVSTKEKYDNIAKLINSQKIALPLMANATQEEQIKSIVNLLLDGSQANGITLSLLVEQLNKLFASEIVVKNQDGKLKISYKDGRFVEIDVDDEILSLAQEQDFTKDSIKLLEGEQLDKIANLVLKETFNLGQGIFAPQIYQVSKDACIFMVEHKWYLGNGAVWDIATNPQYNGKTLDGVAPIIYEYMPDFMQQGLLEKQKKIDRSNKLKTSFKEHAKKQFKQVLSLILVGVLILSMTACSFSDKLQNDEYAYQEITLTQEQEDFNGKMDGYLDSFYVGNGEYKSFLYEKMPEFYQNNTTYKHTVKNIENLYDQALVALSYMQIGEIEEAEYVLGSIYNKEELNKSNLEDTLNTGEIVWVGIAAVQYKLLTGSDKYDDLIARVDKYLNIVHKQDGSYFGEVVYSWVSTEHMLDIVAYYNLKTLYDDSEEVKTRLKLASDYLYTNLYNESKGTFRRGLEDEHYVLDTCSWGIQVLLALQEINPEIYKESQASKIDIEKLLEYAEDNFKTIVTNGENRYENLYKWSSENTSPVSFEWTMEMAVSYNMLADEADKKGNNAKASSYRNKAQNILKDVENYSKALGIESGYISYSDKNEVINYFTSSEGGWLVYVVPAVCTTVGQEVQIEYGSFFEPLKKIKGYNYNVVEKDYKSIGFVKQEGDNWRTYSTSNTLDLSEADTVTIKMSLVNKIPNAKVKVQFLPMSPKAIQNLEGTEFGLYNKDYYFDNNGDLVIKIKMEDFKQETFGTTSNDELKRLLMDLEYIKIIISAGETCFGDELNSTKLNVNIDSINISYKNSSSTTYKQLASTTTQETEPETLEMSIEKMPSETEVLETSFYYDNITEPTEIPSSILNSTMEKINNLIVNGVATNLNIISLILKEETIYSLFATERFINEHGSNNKGAKILSTVKNISEILAIVLAMFLCMIPAISISTKIVLYMITLIMFPIITNMVAHAIIDFRYIKSIGLQEAISLYGGNVSLTKNGLKIKDKEKSVPIYVINDKPKNVKDFNFKSIPTKFKNSKGEIVKGWLGKYNGATILFVEDANYQEVVEQFNQTKQFKTISGIKANVDIIEIDMENKDSGLSYSKSGNCIVGLNLIKTNNIVDIQKEMALLNNKKVEAITINQNIAVFIDDSTETISTSNDMMSSINLYVDSKNLGTNAKVLFTDTYINKILELLEQELGSKEQAKEKFIDIIKQLKKENKEISVVFEQADINTNLEQYFKYGIFSYIANGKYYDGIMLTNAPIKMVTSLDKVSGFDGSLSVLKVSSFKNEILQKSGIFTFLNSALNIKEIMEKRNIEFVKQVAANFAFEQIPNIDINIVAKILIMSENKYESLSKYLQETDSISIYYNGLTSKKEKETFIDSILERIITVNYLREQEISYGLQNKKLETILSKALIEKYKLQGNFAINSNASLNEELKVSEVEFELMKQITELSQKAFEQKDPQAIDDMLKLIPIYADRNNVFVMPDVKVMNTETIEGILSAA